ncbi:MAG TPA: prolipoprotein diacylglyceryl transferase family protein [Actinomycetota bacterium]|nr:prolipoprotein diacylglyceryl transferase family protein [Actinomycetota bacterium]
MLDTLASVGWPVIDRIRIGDFAISPHGIGIAVGFAVGAYVFTKLAVRRGVPQKLADSVVFWSVIGAIVGARVAYVIAHASDFESPLDWFKIWEGGISLLGGIAGATIANAVNIKRQEYRFRFFQVADAVAPGLALGIAVGRIGDLIIGDHLGKPTSWLLAWTYEGGTLAPPFRCAAERCAANLQDPFSQTIDRAEAVLRDAGEVVARGIGVHQTAMYDMILAGLLFAFLWWFIRAPRREGIVTLTFGLAYGCIRLLEDSLRIDKRFGPFTGSQWTALTVGLIAAGLLIYFAVSKRPGPTTPGRREHVPEEGTEPEAAATA